VFSLITREQSNKVYDRFRSIIEKVVTKLINESPWAQSGIPRLTISIDYIIDYFSGAMWASIVWWARNDFAQSSDEMAQNFRFMFFPGLLRALNVKNFADLLDAMAT
jgi:hypothetical protein